MHNRCTPRQRRVLALRMQHNALKCAKMRSRSTKMRCEMHELNAPLWTECRQNAKKTQKMRKKCTSQKRYQFVAKTVLIPGCVPRREPRFRLARLTPRARQARPRRVCGRAAQSAAPLPPTRALRRHTPGTLWGRLADGAVGCVACAR